MTQIVKTKPVDASTTATEGASTRKNRRRGPFGTAHGRRVYAVTFVVVLACCVLFTSGLLMYKNPMELGTPGFWLIAKRRAVSLVAMAIVAVLSLIHI